MKFHPRFTSPVIPTFLRRLKFSGKRTTLHLQETALVVEGEVQRFSLPILDMYLKRALSEWTMITVPYSRIERNVYATYFAIKLTYWLGGLGLIVLLAVWPTLDGTMPPSSGLMALIICPGPLGIFGLLVHFVLRPRHLVTFRHADGRRRLLCFRFRNRGKRLEFMKHLKANIKTARPAAGS